MGAARVSVLLFADLIGIEGTETAATPAGGEVTRIAAGIIATTKPVSDLHEGTKQGGAVVIHQLHQAGFLDESAQLDQVASTGTPLDGPGAGIGQGSGAFGSGDGLAIPPLCPGEAVDFRPDGGGEGPWNGVAGCHFHHVRPWRRHHPVERRFRRAGASPPASAVPSWPVRAPRAASRRVPRR